VVQVVAIVVVVEELELEKENIKLKFVPYPNFIQFNSFKN